MKLQITYEVALKVLDEIWMIPPDFTTPLTITVEELSTTIEKFLFPTEIDWRHKDWLRMITVVLKAFSLSTTVSSHCEDGDPGNEDGILFVAVSIQLLVSFQKAVLVDDPAHRRFRPPQRELKKKHVHKMNRKKYRICIINMECDWNEKKRKRVRLDSLSAKFVMIKLLYWYL